MQGLAVEEKMLSSISRSASVIISAQINRQLSAYFSATGLLTVVLCIHVLFNAIPPIPGFRAAWDTVRGLMQSITVQVVAGYTSGSPNPVLSILYILLVTQVLECLPAVPGWVGDDLDSLTTSVTFIFAEQLTGYLSAAGVPLFGAVLGVCLGGRGLLGKTLAYTGVTALTTWLFQAILGGELALAWPIMLLYFAAEVCRAYDVQDFLHFGLYRAGSAAYDGLSAMAPAKTIAMGFVFLAALQPADTVWTGICALVFVQALSTHLMDQIGFIAAVDPALAGLAVATLVYFGALALQGKPGK